jgi:D-psicose/D-tagatose/L-ribulose 3-epimerase
MKVGMNMLLWTGDALDRRWDRVYARLAELGYDGVEVPVFTLEPEPYRALATRLRGHGLEVLTVTTRGPESNPISPDPEVRAAGLRENLLAVECTAALQGTMMCGPFVSAPGAFSGAPASAQEREWAVELLHRLSDAAAGHGITLAIESLNRFQHYLTTTAAATAELCREVDRPSCRMVYDTYHAHLEEKAVRPAVTACADVLAYVHVSENDRSTPGLGQVAWDATFEALREVGYDGWLTIEAFSQRDPVLAGKLKVWRPAYDTEDRLAAEGITFIHDAWARAARPRVG